MRILDPRRLVRVQLPSVCCPGWLGSVPGMDVMPYQLQSPHGTADARYMVALIVRWSSPRHFCAYVMLLARSGISSNINRAAAISSSVSYALNILELYQSGQERWNTKFAPSLLYLMPITVLDLISNKVIRRTSLASCYS
jgi:hypothetical protein